MEHIRVKSSHLFSLAHDGDTLEARFNCGACGGSGNKQDGSPCRGCDGQGYSTTYTYRGVPKALYHRVLGAPSVGKAFNKLIVSTTKGEKREDGEKVPGA